MTVLQVKTPPVEEGPRRRVVYLDQCVVSPLAKLEMGELRDSPRKEAIRRLHDALLAGVYDRAGIICVESFLHRQESSPVAKIPGREAFFDKMWGLVHRVSLRLHFHDFETMLKLQTLAAMASRDRRLRQMPKWALWRTGLSRDPNDPNSRLLHELDGVRFSIGVKWEPQPRPDNDWAEFMRKERTEKGVGTFEEALPEWVDAMREVCTVYCNCLNWGIFVHDQEGEKIGNEDVESFILSEGFSSVPFVFVWSRIHAAVASDSGRDCRDSDKWDAWILGQAIPYCDLVITDSYMAERVRQHQIGEPFGTVVLGSGNRDLADAAQLVEEW